MDTRALLTLLERKIRASTDPKQKAIDKDIFNILVTMESRISALEKLAEKHTKESEG